MGCDVGRAMIGSTTVVGSMRYIGARIKWRGNVVGGWKEFHVENPSAVNDYLADVGVLEPEETVMELSVAGPGNMNCTIRVRTNLKTRILKQSRPFVARFPEIPAPIERIHHEAAFYQTLDKDVFLRDCMPELISVDSKNFCLLLEDLGVLGDFSFLYQANVQLSEHELDQAVEFISRLHRGFQISHSNPRIANL